MTKKLFIRIEYDKGTIDEYEISWIGADKLLRQFLANPNVVAVTFTVEGKRRADSPSLDKISAADMYP